MKCAALAKLAFNPDSAFVSLDYLLANSQSQTGTATGDDDYFSIKAKAVQHVGLVKGRVFGWVNGETAEACGGLRNLNLGARGWSRAW